MRKLLIILAIPLFLVLIAAGAVAFLVDAGDYKDEIRAGFSEATGRELAIDGDMRASLFPRPFLEITQASVLGALGTEGPTLAELDSLRLYPRFAPLFAGRLEWELVRAEGLRLHLGRDEQGRASRDESQSERRLEIDSLEIFAVPVVDDKPVAWRLTGSIGNSNGDSSARLRAEGDLSVAEGMRRPRLERAMLELEGFGLGKGLAVDFVLRTGVETDLDARRYLAEEAVLDVQVFGEALSGGRIEATVSGRLELDLNAERLQVSDLAIRSGSLSARGAVLGRSLLSAPELTGDLTVGELDLRAWLEQRELPVPETADADTFRRFSLKSDWRLTSDQLGIHDLLLNIDQTRISGEVEPLATSPRVSRFDLHIDRLDLDRYLPVSGRTQGGPEKSEQQPARTDELVASRANPGEQLPPMLDVAAAESVPAPLPPKSPPLAKTDGTLELEGRLRIGDLQLARLRFGDVDIGIKAKSGDLDLDNRVERFYGGRLEGRFGLDLSGNQPVVSLAQRADGIQTGFLLVDLGREDRLTGRGSITADLTASGYSADALRRSLSGKLTIDIPRGVIKGFNLERLVREEEARWRGRSPPKDQPMHTDFKDLHASAELRDGVLRNRDLIANAEHLRITGSGRVDLAEERFDYRFEPTFVKPPKGRGIKELEGIAIPVHLAGPFTQPRWDVDLASVLRAAAERQLGTQGDGLLQELEERTGIKGLGQGLKNLFGR